MNLLTLSFTLLFIIITTFISAYKKLGLGKDIWIGTVRAAVQLIAVGYVLDYVFATKTWYFYIIIILVMAIVASRHAAKRGGGFKGVFWRILFTLLVNVSFVMLILLGLNIIQSEPQYIIPISGMVMGSSMVVAGLFLTTLQRESEASKATIEMLLSLGANQKQALQAIMQRIVKVSMIPTIDALKTVGIVQLPGMMTGMIIAGASPIEAVKYQLLMFFTFTGSAASVSIMLSILFHYLLISKDLRYVPPEEHK